MVISRVSHAADSKPVLFDCHWRCMQEQTGLMRLPQHRCLSLLLTPALQRTMSQQH